MAIGTSEKLAQEGLRGNRDWLAEGKRVGSGVREVSHDLERMRGAGSLLHRCKRRRNLRVRRFRLCEEPRRAVLRDQKIDFLLRLVPDIVECVVAKPEIVPHVNGLEKVACNEVLEACAFVRHFAPVALIPLRRLANRILDVPEPRTDGEALVKVLQRRDPRLYRLLCYADFAGEGCRHNLVSGAGKKKLGQDSYSCNVGNLRKVTQIFPEELFAAELAPAMGESHISSYERLRESAMRPEGVPVFGANGTRCMDFGRFKFGADKFRDAERVHVVEEVTPHQAVAAALVDVEPRAAGDDKAHAVFVEIEEPLEKRLPAHELVNLVKRDDCSAVGRDAETGGIGKTCGIAGDKPAGREVVPGKVLVGKRFGERGLSALTGTREKRHLPVVVQMFFKNRFVDSLSLKCVFHGGKCIKTDLRRQYQTDRWVRMVNTKSTDGSEWYLERNPVGACVPHARRGALLLGLSYENVQYVTLLFCAESGSCEQPARENKEARL